MNYCFECGSKLVEKECINCGISEGMVPYCPVCGEFRFPFFNSAVSMVIFNKDLTKTLLIRQYGNDKNILVAGYVNKGENLETALVRELKEEVNLEAVEYKFNASEYFSKSNTLINNFVVIAKDEAFSLTAEVDYAAWYDFETAKEIILKNSLAERFYLAALKKLPLLACK